MALGTRGDIQPAIALCKSLIEMGHSAFVVSTSNWQELCDGHGIQLRSLGFKYRTLSRFMRQKPRSKPLRFILKLPFLHQMITEKRHYIFFVTLIKKLDQFRENMDVLVSNNDTNCQYLGWTYCNSRGIPFYTLDLQPQVVTDDYPYLYHSKWKQFLWTMIPNGRQLSHIVALKKRAKRCLKAVNLIRTNHFKLPAWSRSQLFQAMAYEVPALIAYSPTIVPVRSAQGPVIVTGPLQCPHPELAIPSSLAQFFKDDPPIYFGLGSIIGSKKRIDDFQNLILEISELTKLKFVYQPGKIQKKDTGPTFLSDRVCVLGHFPHDQLFPHMKLIVHHGGAGTTHSALNAGKPSVIIWYHYEMRLWAQRIETLKAGINVGNINKISAYKLVKAIYTVMENPEYTQNCSDLQKKLISEKSEVKNALSKLWKRSS